MAVKKLPMNDLQITYLLHRSTIHHGLIVVWRLIGWKPHGQSKGNKCVGFLEPWEVGQLFFGGN